MHGCLGKCVRAGDSIQAPHRPVASEPIGSPRERPIIAPERQIEQRPAQLALEGDLGLTETLPPRRRVAPDVLSPAAGGDGLLQLAAGCRGSSGAATFEAGRWSSSDLLIFRSSVGTKSRCSPVANRLKSPAWKGWPAVCRIKIRLICVK